MQVVAKTPHIDLKIVGEVPKKLLKVLEEEYGDNLVVTPDDNELLDIQSTDWYQEMKESMTVGLTLKTYRQREGLSQAELGKLIGDVPKQNISGMERGDRPIGKAMAKRLAKVLKFDHRALL